MSTMRKVMDRNRSKSSNIVGSEKPFIKTEMSFEVSFDYPLNNSNVHLNQLGLPQDNLKTQPPLKPSTSSTAEASIGRPATARNRLRFLSPQDESICPSPTVRLSEDQMDIHEALRSQLPPFRQSKRWAKVYIDKDDEISRDPPSQPVSPPRKRFPFACDISQQETTVRDLRSLGDDESDHFGLCRPAHVRPWQAINKHRLVERHSMPMRVVAVADAKTGDLRREKSLKSIKNRLQTSPRRIAMPKLGRTNSRSRDEHLQYASRVSRVWKKQRSPKRTANNLTSFLPEDLVNHSTERSGSPVSPLHDYGKVKRFSEECVSMLSGLDFGDEWRASLVGNSLSLNHKSSNDTTITDSSRPYGSVSNSAKSNTTTDSCDAPNVPSQSSGHPTTSAPRLADPALLFRSACSSMLEKENINPVAGSNQKYATTSSRTGPLLELRNRTTSDNKQINGRMAKSLKNARSIDTLTEIEAQVGDPPSPIANQLERKSSMSTLSSSPKRQRPMGGPPERPLPDLPKDDISDARSAVGRCPSFASSFKSRPIHEALTIVDVSRMSSVQTIVHLPSVASLKSVVTSNTNLAGVGSKVDESSLSNLSKHISTLRPSSSFDDVRSHQSTKSEASKVKEVTKDRSNRVEMMKRRNVAAWRQSHDDLCNMMSQNHPANVNSLNDPNRERCAPQFQLLVETLPAKTVSNQTPDGEIVMAKSVIPTRPSTANTTLGNNLASRAPRTIPTMRSSQDLASTLSKTNSMSRQHIVRYGKVKQAVSSPDLQQRSKDGIKPKQALGRSNIMVVVDTNPHTSSFRAGAISPSIDTEIVKSRPTTPKVNRKVPKQTSSSPLIEEQPYLPGLDELAEIIDIVKVPASVQRKCSTRSLRSARTVARKIDGTKTNPERASPSAKTARINSRPKYHRIMDSSDSDLEDSPVLKQGSVLSSKGCITPRTNSNRLHRRKDTPLTIILKEEVRKADIEYENLKKYEQRIEYLQSHLDQTLNVWSRMSPNGKRQCLASTLGVNLDLNSCTKVKTESRRDDAKAVAPDRAYSKQSKTHGLDDAVSRSLKEALECARNAAKETWRTSHSSATTHDGTDTDTDGPSDNLSRIIDKRSSEGSLTDPQDYDLTLSARHSYDSKTDKEVQQLKLKADLLGADLDEFRSRLRATRGPAIPARRHKTSTRPGTANSSASAAIRPMTRGDSKVPANRLAIAPWEGQEKAVSYLHGSTENFKTDLRINRLTLGQETLRTDQMDSMLAF